MSLEERDLTLLTFIEDFYRNHGEGAPRDRLQKDGEFSKEELRHAETDLVNGGYLRVDYFLGASYPKYYLTECGSDLVKAHEKVKELSSPET